MREDSTISPRVTLDDADRQRDARLACKRSRLAAIVAGKPPDAALALFGVESSDHLTRAWQHTSKLPTVAFNCSNKYGPPSSPVKLIPLVILNALAGGPTPVYGRGENIRDLFYVEDHARLLRRSPRLASVRA